MDQQSFLFQSLIYLAAAVICVPIAKRLGLGSVLGYLIAGIIIGPYILGFIGEEGEDIMHFAEFGVVMMLFLIGLELAPQLLWRMRKSILGLGGLQVFCSTMVIGGLAYLLGSEPREAVVLGMVLSLSSTAIVLQTMQEKNLLKSAAGQSSFSVLLFQDIAVIPMLAILPLLATGTVTAGNTDHGSLIENFPGWQQGVIVMASIIFIIIAGKLLLRPMFTYIAKTGLRELFTAFALLIVIGISVLMSQVGLSPALGAFIAGVVLANSEYRHELESDIEPFKGLLLGLFFVAVGASIDFTLVMNDPLEIMGWVFMLMTVKCLILLALGSFFGMSREQNFIFAFSLGQAGEFAFVLFAFALQGNILPAETIHMMMAVVAITMSMTPLMILLNEKFILPMIKPNPEPEKIMDTIDEKNAVIIAGFGQFGTTTGRFLRANNINATYLDVDSDKVAAMRKLGFKVFYGDASRHDMLLAAGAAKAKMIIITLNDQEKRLRMVDTIKKHFPHLHILTRAADRNDAYKLMNEGLLHVYIESLDTSLRVGIDAMRIMGMRAYKATRLAKTFLRYDEKNLKRLAGIRSEEEYIIEARKRIEELELIIQSDDQTPTFDRDAGWDPETLREEARN